MMIQAVLSNPSHPEYGVATIPFPIPRDQYAHCMELLEALEAATFCTPVSLGGFPQTAGMKLTVDCTKDYDKNDTTYPGSTYYGPKSINRVVINSINGKEFKANEVYAVVTNNFCAGGGDTYYAFAAASSQFDTGLPLDEVLMDYITTELKGVIGAQYAAPQGRILLNPFKDVKVSSWFGQYVIDLYNDGIINGTSATTYAPNDTLTWAAALKLLLVSHGDLKAADATGADWSKNAIAKAAELGLVAADLDGAKAISLPSSKSLPSPRPRASSLTAPTVMSWRSLTRRSSAV